MTAYDRLDKYWEYTCQDCGHEWDQDYICRAKRTITPARKYCPECGSENIEREYQEWPTAESVMASYECRNVNDPLYTALRTPGEYPCHAEPNDKTWF